MKEKVHQIIYSTPWLNESKKEQNDKKDSMYNVSASKTASSDENNIPINGIIYIYVEGGDEIIIGALTTTRHGKSL